MLKPADPIPPPERPIGELVHELVEEGKAYAKAEVELARLIATAKAKALALPAGLFAGALFIAMAALNALAVGIVLALTKFIGPLAAGFIALVIFGAIAAVLVWVGIDRVRRIL